MSRLCRLKTKSHGDDGLWAYNEIVKLRKQRDELLTLLEKINSNPCNAASVAAWSREGIEIVKGGAA